MLVLQLKDLDTDYIYFGNPIKNNIITNGIFYHINYTTHYFSLNTIYIDISNYTDETIAKIKKIEYDILSMVTKKTKQTMISNYLNDKWGEKLILKISGVWETSTQCGLSFKFIHPQKNAITQLNSTI